MLHGNTSLVVMLLLVLVMTGCGEERRISEGRFQKRQHRGGWHVDLHRGRTGVSQPRPMGKPDRAGPDRQEAPLEIPAPSSNAPATHGDQPVQASTIKTGGQLIVHVPIGTPAHRSADQRSPVTLNEAVIDIHAPRTRQGGLEITALLAFLLVVAFWILLLASAGEAALLLLALSAVLALVALSRITARQKQGAGFAIFALVNAIFFGILMLLYAGGDL